MNLALDAMGGDFAPEAPVEGALLFAREFPEHEVVLVGVERRLEECLAGRPRPDNVRLHHAPVVVTMDDHPAAAVKAKKNSSLALCFALVREGLSDAMVSAGNSGAVMAFALVILGRIEGVKRPAIAALFPALSGKGRCLLLDAGANVDCRAVHLAQFAVMGEAYMRRAMEIRRPRVALLSNGEEESKGTVLTREAHGLLRRLGLDYRGYAEGKDIFSGEVDVMVTDGFTGNVVLKAAEGAGMAVARLVRETLEKSGLSERVGALLLRPTLAGVKKVVDYAEYGGAPLLGVRGVSLVAHGRSNAVAIKNALKAALLTSEAGVKTELVGAFSRVRKQATSRSTSG